MRARGLEILTVAALLGVFTFLVVGEAVHQSVTVDEFHLVPQAIALRATGDLRLGFKTPPLFKRWIGLAVPPGAVTLPDPNVNGRPAAHGWEPWIYGTRFMALNASVYDRIFFRARMAMLPVAWVLGLCLWGWARSSGGPRAGLVALVLFAFSPEMIAFSSLVSLDLAVTTLVAGFLVLLREHLARGRWWSLAAASLCFGLALSVKMSALFLAPMLALPIAGGRGAAPWRRRLGAAALAGATALLAIHASYGFDRPVVRLRDLEPKSRSFKALAAALPGGLPVPLPAMLVRAADSQARDVQAADVPSYLDGEWSSRGWRRYYALAYLYKTPLPVLLLLGLVACAAAVRFVRSRGATPRARCALDEAPEGGSGIRSPSPAVDAALVVAPLLLWGGAFSLSGGLNIGIRYVLPCYAILCVGLGVAAASLASSRVGRAGVAALLVSLAAVSIAAYPHHLSYFNAWPGGGREGAWRRLVDSNLDWGQELRHLASWLRERDIGRVGLGYFGHVAPEMAGIDYFVPEAEPPREGWYAISANFLAGYPYLVYDHGRLRPVREGHFAAFRALEPVDTIAGALMIYRVAGPADPSRAP